MKTTRILTLAALLVSLLVLPVKAGDFATLNFIGFSKDGRYLAFEEYGTQDGSGFPYASFYVIDVAKNSFASPEVTVRLEQETATEQMARARAKLRAAAALKRFRIIAGNTGTLLVSRLLTDITAYDRKDSADERKINFAEVIGSMYREGDYDLILRPSNAEVKDCTYLDDPPKKLELLLRDNNAEKTLVLQKDASLPASRGCPMSYEMQRVYVYQNFIAVFLNTYHMGFEGPDMRYMVITGKYK
jgi:predicted secreted protein